jgi:hypothetical protein
VIGRDPYCSSECRDIAKKERVEALAARQKVSAKEEGPAHYAVVKALKEGRLTRKPCEFPGCESPKSISHHPDYSKEKELDVVWLCRPHHQLEHARLRREGKEP